MSTFSLVQSTNLGSLTKDLPAHSTNVIYNTCGFGFAIRNNCFGVFWGSMVMGGKGLTEDLVAGRFSVTRV